MHAANGVGFQVAAAALGQALMPWLVGAAAQRASLEILGPVLVALAIALVALHEALLRAGHERRARVGYGRHVTTPPTTRWDPALYARFERERSQPFFDLVARIETTRRATRASTSAAARAS